jgi:hypothetical protein
MRPVETQYFASPQNKNAIFCGPVETQYFASPQNKNAKYCVSTICPVKTQNIASPKIKTQNFASLRYARYRRKILRLYDMPGTDAKYCVSTACHGRRHESRISYLCILRKSHP